MRNRTGKTALGGVIHPGSVPRKPSSDLERNVNLLVGFTGSVKSFANVMHWYSSDHRKVANALLSFASCSTD